MSELIITNGDSTVSLLRAAGFEADILPWRDVLHEGPVPTTAEAGPDDLEGLSLTRAKFLAEAFGESEEKLIDSFKERDRKLRDHRSYDELTLWFEHDLYDQLQLLQILAFFHRAKRSASLQLVQSDDYLGRQTPDSIEHFEALKRHVSKEQTTLAHELFEAFREPSPVDLSTFLKGDLSPLPFVQRALLRLFEELPSTTNGVSRTQHQALQLIKRDGLPPRRLFGEVQAAEEAVFMGDWSFRRCLEELVFNKIPLVRGLPSHFFEMTSDDERQCYLDARLRLTDAGHGVLLAKADHAEINSIDRWLGGTHVTSDNIWRWDREARTLAPPPTRQ